jgi:hypothetical protein
VSKFRKFVGCTHVFRQDKTLLDETHSPTHSLSVASTDGIVVTGTLMSGSVRHY